VRCQTFRLINLYGCSEVPEISHFEILRHTELAGTDAPIGYLISGTEAHIVDDDLREVEPGEIGELLVGSHLQARGYLERPAETAARFINNPFGGTQRLYRTGDRVRMNPDGLLLFRGACRRPSQGAWSPYRNECCRGSLEGL
jgi:non-ribosomal peptide synthetase component F